MYKFKLILHPGDFNKQIEAIDYSFADKIIWIDKEKIQGHYSFDVEPEDYIVDRLDCGNIRSVDEYSDFSTAYRSTMQIFEKNYDFQESDQFKVMKNHIQEQGYSDKWGAKKYRSVEEIEDYFKNLQKTYESIKNDGYLTQKELGNKNPYHEIKVIIDEDGSIYKASGGNHRFAIVNILDINSIPVHVKKIHINWAKKQFKNYDGDALTAINKGLEKLNQKSVNR